MSVVVVSRFRLEVVVFHYRPRLMEEVTDTAQLLDRISMDSRMLLEVVFRSLVELSEAADKSL